MSCRCRFRPRARLVRSKRCLLLRWPYLRREREPLTHAFVLHDEDAGLAAAICRRLDGLPLAIEMAAARVATLGLETLANNLDERFRILTEGRRTAVPRHQTLRATLEWSHDLLGDASN
jgi:predicted ATPase